MHYSELNYNSSKEIRALLEAAGIRLQKRFGQNFLIDPHVRSAICRLAAPKPCTVWEVGPGIGSLTHLFVEQGCQLRVFEIDHGIISMLKELFQGSGLQIEAGDCVQTLPIAWQQNPAPDVLVGNLPYNAAGAIIMAMLEKAFIPSRFIVMVQRESAQRMTALPGSKDYSAYSVACQARVKVRSVFDVLPGSFFPVPEVTSTVVEMTPLSDGGEGELPAFFSSLVRRAFQSRRKTFANNFRKVMLDGGISGEMVMDACREAGIPPDIRAEKVSVEQFISLAKLIARQEHP
ncbi:MAG: ribosomal RNA small subunit methyltransferase A [Spirochaetaceae bacterium]|nr:MAG: ribosomal RNA small subunit methyltransferase A [Spirochaetaceae bacterium]